MYNIIYETSHQSRFDARYWSTGIILLYFMDPKMLSFFPLVCMCVCVCVRAHMCVRARVCSVTQSCPTLCDLMNCSLLGSSVHGIFQARILEQVAFSYSRGSSPPRD